MEETLSYSKLADVNCVPNNFVKNINAPVCEKVKCDVIDYSCNKIKILDQVQLTCVDVEENKSFTTNFLVVDDFYETILGLEASILFGLIQRINSVQSLMPNEKGDFITKNNNVVDGLGKIPGTCSIVLKENSVTS